MRNLSKQKGFTVVELLFCMLALVGVFGWIANIWQLVSMMTDPTSALLVLKIVGIFVAPFGSVLGWIGIF